MVQASKTILVIGATGAMGRPIIRHLLASPNNWHIRAFTRDIESPHAQKLLTAEADDQRVELFKGDLNDSSSVEAAMDGVYGVFCNTDFFSSLNVRTEYEQGIRALQAAQAAEVKHFIWSSLDAAASLSDGRTPVPHYDSKAAVEHRIDMERADELMRGLTNGDGWYSVNVTVLVTGPYYENLQASFAPNPGKLSDGREGLVFNSASGGKPHPMIAIDDIAWFTRQIFENPKEWGGYTLRVLGEMPTMAEVAHTFERVTGIPAEWRDLPLDAVRAIPAVGQDLAAMHHFFQEYRLVRNFEALRRLHPSLLTFEDWLHKTNWRGEPLEVQKPH